MWSRMIKMQEFAEGRFMLLARMLILVMCPRMKFIVLGVGIV
jgi:hypothetical protein